MAGFPRRDNLIVYPGNHPILKSDSSPLTVPYFTGDAGTARRLVFDARFLWGLSFGTLVD